MKNIFFISFPRSGSNWVLGMIGKTVGEKWVGYTGENTEYDKALFVKSHCYIRYSGKTIYMYRHPKDTLLSWAKELYRMAKDNNKIDIDKVKLNGTWIKNTLKGKGYKHPYSISDGHVKSDREEVEYHFGQVLGWETAKQWIAHMKFYMHPPKDVKGELIYVRYEDMVKNPVEELKKLLAQCGLDASKVTEKAIKDYMRENATEISSDKWKKDKKWTTVANELANLHLKPEIGQYNYKLA